MTRNIHKEENGNWSVATFNRFGGYEGSLTGWFKTAREAIAHCRNVGDSTKITIRRRRSQCVWHRVAV